MPPAQETPCFISDNIITFTKVEHNLTQDIKKNQFHYVTCWIIYPYIMCTIILWLRNIYYLFIEGL